LSGLPHVVARLSWVYGPMMRRDSHIRVLARMCRRGHPFTRIDFPGRVIVAFVEDVARAIVQLTLKPELAHPVYLVAHEQPVSFGEMLSRFAASFHGLEARRPAKAPWAAVAMRTVMVNACAPMLLARQYLAGFRTRSSGTIVNVSSSAAYFPTPGLAPYGATKAFLTAFSEALIAECDTWRGVHVIGFCPSGMATNFQRAAGVKNEDSNVLLDPRAVAARMLD